MQDIMKTNDQKKKVTVREGRQLALARAREYLRKEQLKPGYRRKRNKITHGKKNINHIVDHPKSWDDRATLYKSITPDILHDKKTDRTIPIKKSPKSCQNISKNSISRFIVIDRKDGEPDGERISMTSTAILKNVLTKVSRSCSPFDLNRVEQVLHVMNYNETKKDSCIKSNEADFHSVHSFFKPSINKTHKWKYIQNDSTKHSNEATHSGTKAEESILTKYDTTKGGENCGKLSLVQRGRRLEHTLHNYKRLFRDYSVPPLYYTKDDNVYPTPIDRIAEEILKSILNEIAEELNECLDDFIINYLIPKL